MRKVKHKLAIYGKMYGHTLPTAEKMEKRMNDYFALQVHPILKFAPLELKNVCINIGARTAIT